MLRSHPCQADRCWSADVRWCTGKSKCPQPTRSGHSGCTAPSRVHSRDWHCSSGPTRHRSTGRGFSRWLSKLYRQRYQRKTSNKSIHCKWSTSIVAPIAPAKNDIDGGISIGGHRLTSPLMTIVMTARHSAANRRKASIFERRSFSIVLQWSPTDSPALGSDRSVQRLVLGKSRSALRSPRSNSVCGLIREIVDISRGYVDVPISENERNKIDDVISIHSS